MVRFRIKRRARPFSLLPFLLAAAFAFLAWRFDRMVEPVLMNIAEMKVSVMATDLVNRLVGETIVAEFRSDRLMTVEKNEAGDVVLIQLNTVEINRLSTTAVAAVQEGIKSISGEDISIPIGQAFGIRVFSAVGPDVKVRVVPMGKAVANITDTFESAGINQVKHCVYLTTEVTLRLMLPLDSSPVVVRSSVPLTTMILPGKVPVTYLDIR